ncbi:MalY/PatB family protein [Actinomyces mediterranea]|uniref:MalY/PatB family protein n=1 Tax=Actinomyces mediterranea TaxID=1871028 RepID=UPI0009706F9B|nr:aminotransferase class I/II-fold pyridoxal phosphate-dependent enzyme [Actinomyces mediterranea]
MNDSDPDFTTRLSRWGTHSAKWDLLASRLGDDVIALSVADMEFQTCSAVVDAVTLAALHGSYGYTEVFPDFAEAAVGWQRRRHGWAPDAEDVHFFPRVVQCVSALVNFILPSEDGRRVRVATLSPAYSPLLEVCERSGVELARIPLADTATRARIDWGALETALHDADLFLWTNPHNPTGRVWTTEELRRLADILREGSVLVLSDDIHSDFTRPGRPSYTALAAIAPDLWESGRIIQCASPGKTFTIAGLEATAICVHGELGDRLEAGKRRMGLHNPNYFAIPAVLAAWNEGGPWADELLRVIDRNIRAALDIFARLLPDAAACDPDGTYLIWVDASAYIEDEEDLARACRAARVAVSPGGDFGPGYEQYFRVNTALPRRDLEKGLIRLCSALAHREAES